MEKQIEISAPMFLEHSGIDKKSQVYNDLLECEYFNYVVNLHSLPPNNNSVEYLEHVKITVYDNTKLLPTVKIGLNYAFRKAFTSNGKNQN